MNQVHDGSSEPSASARPTLGRTRVLAGLLSASDADSPLRVAIVSQRAAMRYGLRHLVAQHVRNAQFVAPDSEPDLVVYDLVEVDDDDVERLKEVVATTQAVVIAVSLEAAVDQAALAGAAAAAGVDGFFSFGLSEDDWLDAVGGAVIDQAFGHHGADSSPPPDADLTKREFDVLTLIARGRTNHEICAELVLSPNTVKTYIRTAYKKIGVTSRAQALGWMVNNGLIPRSPSHD